MKEPDARPPLRPDMNNALPLAGALRRYFRRHVPAQEVEDLVQEVFLNLQARRRDAPIEDMERYVFSVAGNLLRRRTRAPQLLLTGSPEDLDIGNDITPERIAIDFDRLRRTERAIQALPQRTQQIFVLHRFEDMTYPSIARGLGISVSAVEKHIIAGLKALRDALGDTV